MVIGDETSVTLQCKSSEFGMAIINQFWSNIPMQFSQKHKATRHIVRKEDQIIEGYLTTKKK
jgi:hypothetical protein